MTQQTAEDERAAIVAWLRGKAYKQKMMIRELRDDLSDAELKVARGHELGIRFVQHAIERGEHHKETGNGI